uniref:Phospholipase A2 n=1 Tax=Protobothrops mangshanensis TaxID=242058 RepID=A0A0H3U271_PROMB|nr:phospholipase A2 [Protobothrops mangshanensis]
MRTLWIMAVLLVGIEGGLLQFELIIKKVTGRSSIVWYGSYGCYCGKGGQGRPQDATDRCCLMHDCCYENLTGCKTKTDPYPYSRENGVMVCGDDDLCKKEVCECDRAAAICFRDNLDTYQNKYWLYPASKCKEESEPC